MNTIKDAADALLSKGKISKEEYDLIEKTGSFAFEKKALKNPTTLRKVLLKLRQTGRSLKEQGKVVKPNVVGVGLAGAAGMVGKELIFDPIKMSIDIKKSLKQLKAKTPQLEEKDDSDIQDYFNVVKTFSPKAASNPLVAGALVNKMMEFGGVDHKLVQDISAIESGLSRPSFITPALSGVASSAIGIPG